MYKILFCAIIHWGCTTNNNHHTKENKDAIPDEIKKQLTNTPPIDTLLNNYTILFNYLNKGLVLSSAFRALNSDGKNIERYDFFKAIASGEFLPIRVEDSIRTYQLYTAKKANATIKAYLQHIGNFGIETNALIGKPLPEFQFTDLNGEKFSAVNTKGKMIFIKTWFTNCGPCIEEMPTLNKIVDKYKDRKDVLFLSLAFDSKKVLQQFVTNTTFKYKVIPVAKSYVFDKLKNTYFPRHYFINQEGNVAEVFDHTNFENNLQRLLNP